MTTDRVGKLLERVARDVTGVAQRSSENCYGPTKEVLELFLGPLLRAGQAMRDGWTYPSSGGIPTNYGPHTWAWDAALKAALATLEGRDGKFDDRKSNQSPWRPSRQTRGWMGARSQFDLGDD